MKLNYISILMLALLATGAIAQTAQKAPLTVAVYDFKGEKNAAGYGTKVTTLVTAWLTTRTNLVMLERAELNEALSEQAFGVTGLVSSDAAAQIGQITGAKVLVCGQILKPDQNHLAIVATIVGTETGRLFAAKVEGAPDNLMELTSDLSSIIERTILDHAADLTTAARESGADRLERIIKSIRGTNRPPVSIKIFWPKNNSRYNATTECELGLILLKAGFPMVDERSDVKADIEITGVGDHSEGPHNGGLFSNRAVIELKVQRRQTGDILVFDRQESMATGLTRGEADRLAQVRAVDALAERILPLLAK